MRSILSLFLVGGLISLAALLLSRKAQGDVPKQREALAKNPVYYGEVPAFWESHTLVAATVETVRFHDDGVSLFTSDALTLRVQESVPPRYLGARLAMTFTFPILSVRDRPQNLKPHFRVGERLLVLLENGKRRAEADESFVNFAMMPGEGDWYSYSKDDDPRAVETLKLCRAIATKDVGERLELIEALLKERPDERVRGVLRRSLTAAVSQSKQDLERASRLLKEVGKR